MIINGIRNRIKLLGFYIPVTFYFAVFVVTATLAYQLLKGNVNDNGSSFVDIFFLLIKVAIWFGAIVVMFSFLTVLVSYLFFLWKDKKGVTFLFETEEHDSGLNNEQQVNVKIYPILKPIFGFLKLRLQYDSNHFSKKFSLHEKSGKALFNTKIDGKYKWDLPEIREYNLHKSILYFEDIFQFFSIAVDLPVNKRFYVEPTARATKDVKVLPRQTEDTTTRIEELRRVEGEFLNYKNFENNDDVRRIVWKIYAKNKELVVRIPENIDPYASHIYLYASFFSSHNITGNATVEVPFLNYYKVMTWNLYESLTKKGFEIKFISDQQTIKRTSGEQSVKYNISTSKWQRTVDLNSYVKPKNASLVIISSLSDVEQVRALKEMNSHIKFVFIKLTDSLFRQNLMDWVQWIFIKNEDTDIENYRRTWAFSNLRSSIVENEKKLEALIENYVLAVK